MNKFRNDLHSAFLIEGFDGSYRYGPDDPEGTPDLMEGEENFQQTPREREEYAAAVEAAEATDKVIDDTKKSLDDVQTEVVDEILKDPDFSKVVDEVVKEKRKTEDFENKKKIFQERLNSPDSQGQKYRDIWNQQVKEGFNLLIKNLENDGFFADCKNKSQKNKKIATMKAKYTQIVKNQYEIYVWDADEEKFNANKDKIFSTNDNMSPTNSILYNLRNIDDSNVTRDKLEANATEQKLKEGQEVTSEKVNKRIKFLAHELPNYLREIKDTNFFQKVFLQMNVPSDTDKEEVANFIKLVDKLDGENAEVKLIKIFNELEKGASDDAIKAKLAENELTLKKDSEISKIKKSFNFYVDIMNPNNPVKNQHAVYLNIITIIETEGGFDKAIAAYKTKVDEYKARKNQEKKRKTYEQGKILDQDLKSFVDELHHSVDTEDKRVKRKANNTKYDYTRVTRLNEKSDDYFAQTEVVDILADINNDREITAADRGTQKTGTQFKEVYETVKNMLGGDEAAENKIIDNLLEQAKIYNNMLPDTVKIPDEEFTKDQIQKGNKKLVLLLQTIISEGGRDLYPLLMCGSEADKKQSELYNALKDIPESSEDPRVQAAAKELLEKNGITPDTSFDDLQGVTYESLCKATAGALHVAYLNTVDESIKGATSVDAKKEDYIIGGGAGIAIPFDKWVKGLSLNVGIQAGKQGEGGNSKIIPGFGLNLAYSPTIDIQNGWSVTPNLHCGFIMLGPIPALDLGTGVEFAKEWVSKNHVLQKVGGGVGVDYYVLQDTLVFSANVGWSRDKLRGIENDKEKMGQAFNKEIITPLLDNIASKFNGKEFDLTNTENCKLVDAAVDEIVNKVIGDKKSDFSPADIVKLKETTVRLLINYNKAPIDNKNVRRYIANEISDCYASIWTEQNLNALNNKIYLSGLRAGVSFAWLVGSCYFSAALHLGMSFKKHRNDGYGDGSIEKYEIIDVNITGDHWDAEMIEKFNKYLEKDAKLSLTDDGEYIVLSQNVIEKYNILLNPGMKGLIKKDESGNVLLSVETYMNLPRIFRGVATKSTDILIGGGKIEEAKRLDEVISNDEWFTTGDIDIDKLPGKEIDFTIQLVNDVLNDLKRKLPDDSQLQVYQIEESFAANLEKGHKYKITLTKNNNEITRTYEEITTGDPLQIEYIGTEKVELMDNIAQKIAKDAYDEARKVKSNRLYNISHGEHRWTSYVDFAKAMGKKEYQRAKDIIIKMLPEMDKKINELQGNDRVEFEKKLKPELEKLSNDDVALGQALLSINNVFARVSAVQGGIGENKTDQETYHFVHWEGGKQIATPMGNIIKGRAGEIKRKINNSKELSSNVKNSYTSLINAMENYREANPDYYKATSKERTTLSNAVGINLGNAINIENPLFNPEIYEGSQIKLEDLPDFNGKNTLQQHAMEVMAKDKSLMGPILKHLNVPIPEGSNKIDYELVNYEEVLNEKNEKVGELTINIGGKEVKFRADMSVGYFSQCVNHMILLDNIEAEVEGGNERVKFKAPVNGNGRYEEGTVESITATSAGHVNFAAGLGKFGKGEDQDPGADSQTGEVIINNNKRPRPGVTDIPNPDDSINF